MSLLPPAPSASTPEVRAVMIANRRKDTRPERALRSELHARGLRFRVDRKIGSGRSSPRPDVSFSRQKVAVFVDGCYWHGCPEHGVRPRTNSSYWAAKIALNQARDRRNTAALEHAGWLVLRVWEHEPAPEAAERVQAAVFARR